jgi:hypothetical protein
MISLDCSGQLPAICDFFHKGVTKATIVMTDGYFFIAVNSSKFSRPHYQGESYAFKVQDSFVWGGYRRVSLYFRRVRRRRWWFNRHECSFDRYRHD